MRWGWMKKGYAVAEADVDIRRDPLLVLRVQEELASRFAPPDAAVHAREYRESMYKIMEALLSPREEYIVRHRFGIGTRREQEMTRKEIALDLGISYCRVHQIERRALSKLTRRLRQWNELNA
jgi:RNA polymerase sigma factor (sigma-70 family)